jgi:hypothetical protein
MKKKVMKKSRQKFQKTYIKFQKPEGFLQTVEFLTKALSEMTLTMQKTVSVLENLDGRLRALEDELYARRKR